MKRFLSLDVFRGMALLLMIILYNQWGDSVFAPLALHKADSVTLAELLFPIFLFLMGASMWFSSHRPLYGVRNTRTKTRQMGRIFRRTLILFCLGLLLNWIPFETYFAFVRLPGVLQRIALAYFFAAVLTLYLPRIRASVLSICILLVGYWLLLDSQGTDIIGRVDVAVLGSAHLLTPDFDPDGILSTLPAIASVLFGYIAGRLMDQPNSLSGGIGSLMVTGVLLAAAGLLLDLVSPMSRAWCSSSNTCRPKTGVNFSTSPVQTASSSTAYQPLWPNSLPIGVSHRPCTVSTKVITCPMPWPRCCGALRWSFFAGSLFGRCIAPNFTFRPKIKLTFLVLNSI